MAAGGKNDDSERIPSVTRADTQSLPIELSTIADSPDCVKIIDSSGRLEYINRVGREALGLADADISGRMWLDLLPDDTRNAGQAAIAGASKGKSQHFVGTSSDQSGSTRYWDNNLIPIDFSDGKPPKILCISRDITDSVHMRSFIAELLSEAALPQLGFNRVDSRPLSGAVIASLSDGAPTGSISIPAILRPVAKDHPGRQNNKSMLLTEKERESLFWVGKGKTAFETAIITGRSRRTIEFHLANATRKLQASNKVQAALVAFAHRLI